MTFNWIVLSKQLFLQGATFLKILCVNSKETIMFLSSVCKAAHVEVHYTGCFFNWYPPKCSKYRKVNLG